MSCLILMYHRVAASGQDDRYTVSAEDFRRQMHFLREGGFSVVSLPNLTTQLAADTPGKKNLAVTFDDGFEDTYRYAVPTLVEHAFPATFFVVTRLAGSRDSWNTSGGAGYPLMTWRQIATLGERGFELGSHTCTHPVLTDIAPRDAKAEIEDSKKELEDRLGTAIQSFAYPYGRCNNDIRDLVELAGYARACATASGFNDSHADRFMLRRLDIYGTDSLATFRRKLAFGANRVSMRETAGYYLKRAHAKWLAR